jgi:hypothetical protein
VAARIAELRGQPAEVAAHRDAQAAWLKAGGQFGDMAHALRKAAEAYAWAKRTREACERYYRAAQSFYGAGQRTEAAACVSEAVSLAQALNDETLLAPAKALQTEMEGDGNRLKAGGK